MREGLRVRELANDEGNRLLRIVRRCSGSADQAQATFASREALAQAVGRTCRSSASWRIAAAG